MKPHKISIKMEEYGPAGWQWVQRLISPATTETVIAEYRTNHHGDGLWTVGTYEGKEAHNYQDSQILGTCQFSLSHRRRHAYQQIRRWIMKSHTIPEH